MGAKISACGKYRYWLTRPAATDTPEKGTALFIMLNPSTADAELDDPTIRRCRGFAETWDCAGLTVGNLYALRATDPKELSRALDPVGPSNDMHLYKLCQEYGDVVCAWGTNAKPERVQAFCAIAERASVRLWCLGTTKSGAPRHPLYIKADQSLIAWPSTKQGSNPHKLSHSTGS